MHNIIAFLIYLFFLVPAQGKVVDKIIAVVGDEAITLSEFNDFLEHLKHAPPDVIGKDSVVLNDKARALDLLIEEKIFEKEIKRLNLVPTESEIKTEIDNIQARLNLNEKQLRALLRERGTSYEIYIDFIKRQVEQRRLISQEIRSNISISKEDIQNYYQQNIAKAQAGAEYRVRQILLIPDPKNELETRKRAEQLVRRLRAGEDFATLARQNSQGPEAGNGGDLGWIRFEELIPEFQRPITSLRIGAVSDPFKTSFGIHLLQVVDIRQPTPPELDPQLEERIRNHLFQERISVLLHQWIEQKKRPEDGYFVKKML